MAYRKRIFGSFLAATIVLLAVALAVTVTFKQMNRQKQLVEHTYNVINDLEGVISDLKDVQSSVRGYVITGMDDYLTPYFVSEPRIEEGLARLEILLADNQQQSKRLKLLKEHTISRVSIAKQVMDAYKAEGQEKAFELIRKGTGKHEMDEIRAMVSDMVSVEQTLLSNRRNAVDNSSRMTVIAGISGLVLCFSILVAVFYLINRENRSREKTEDDLKSAFDDVETINRETQTISKMGDYLRSCYSNHEAYDMISKNLPHLFPETYGSVYLFNNSRNLLHSAISWGGRPVEEFKDFEPEDCWALRQGRTHESLENSQVPVCSHIHNLADDAAVCIPMQAHGETFGQIFIAAEPGFILDERRRMTIRSVAEQISLALANLNLQSALKEQSIHDPLTKLFNRRYLEETLGREHSRTKRSNQTLALLMMDIDFFKKVNDTYGHDAGDAVLVSFAKMLGQKIRKEDIACRLGGEEFLLVLPSASLELAIKRAEDINQTTRDLEIKHGAQTIQITVSIGIAIMPRHGDIPEEILQKADEALYAAKKSGRDKFVVYTGT